MPLNNSTNHLIPAIFDNPAWEDKIVLLQFVRIRGKAISTIEMHPDVLRTLEATNPANLKPFLHWKVTGTGNIQFDSIGAMRYTDMQVAKLKRAVNPHNPIYPPAMKMIHGYRDVRSAQANDRDSEPGEY